MDEKYRKLKFDYLGDYMSKAFLGKMNIRTNFIYKALQLGYSILQVDIDIIFLQVQDIGQFDSFFT